MDKKEVFKPIDLGHLEDKALAIVDAFRKTNDVDRSAEYRAYFLKEAENIANTLLRDFGYCFDKYEIGGVIPYGLDEVEEVERKLPVNSQNMKESLLYKISDIIGSSGDHNSRVKALSIIRNPIRLIAFIIFNLKHFL